MRLHPAFLDTPLAHRGLHDAAAARPENSRAAFRAAIEAGYGIELDVQGSADGAAMVFHDDALDRLTAARGPLRARSARDLGALALSGGDGEGVPTLPEVLDLVGGRVPVLIEVKDQTGAMGPVDGTLERAVAQVVRGRSGPLAVMSFNPHSVASMARLAPGLARGLTTGAWGADWGIAPARRDALREIPDYDRCGACFVSHEAADLDRPRLAALRAQGASILCWTIRSPEAEARARRMADGITFEGYRPPLPG